MTIHEGFVGRYFEDFEIGDIYRHSVGRTITEIDEVWFSGLVFNTNQLHFNKDYVTKSGFKKADVNPLFISALVTGMSAGDVSRNGFNLEWTEIKAPNPLYIGETVYSDSEVIAKRESSSRKEQGIVTVKSRAITESGKVVLEFKRNVLVYKKEFAPQVSLFPEVTL